MSRHYPIVIIGSGCAGLSAAVYAGRADNDPLVIRGDEPGGQLTLTSEVANYPGFPESITGQELISRMQEQAESFGAQVKNGIVEEVSRSGGTFTVTFNQDTTVTADSIIVASGASARTLDIPGVDELLGYGVSTCATCDGAFFRGQDMAVIGGGDAACEESVFLTKFADTVHLVHRRDELRAEAYWENQLMEHVESGDIEVHWNTELTEIHGSQNEGIEDIDVVTHPDGHPKQKIDNPDYDVSARSIDVEALFFAIGHTPNTSFLENTEVELNEAGYVSVDSGVGEGSTGTDAEGIFAAGDVFDYHYQQAATAVGTGVQAALDADAFLESKN